MRGKQDTAKHAQDRRCVLYCVLPAKKGKASERLMRSIVTHAPALRFVRVCPIIVLMWYGVSDLQMRIVSQLLSGMSVDWVRPNTRGELLCCCFCMFNRHACSLSPGTEKLLGKLLAPPPFFSPRAFLKEGYCNTLPWKLTKCCCECNTFRWIFCQWNVWRGT